jgi:hypothetical protein
VVDASRVLVSAEQVTERSEVAERPEIAERPEAAERPEFAEWQEVSQPQAPPAPPAAPPAGPEAPLPAEAPVVISGSEIPAPGRIIVNGKEITIGDGAPEVFTTTGMPFPPDIPGNVYMLAKDGIWGFTLMVVAFPVFGFLKALVNRRAATQQALPSRDVTDRLHRIESAVEAMSVEVERISEGQRFVTKVLTERSSTPG